MTPIQLVVTFFAAGVVLTLGAAFDVLTVLDDLGVRMAGVFMPAWDLVVQLWLWGTGPT